MSAAARPTVTVHSAQTGAAAGSLPLPSVLPLVLAGSLGAVGVQTALGGFLLAIIAGHDAAFVPGEEDL